MSLRFSHFLLTLGLAMNLAGKPPQSQPAELLYLDNGHMKIGIDRSMGASIAWLSWKGYPKNTINIHDPGRLIQQSYYAGNSLDRIADGQHKAWSPWPWNPIQGGGVGSWANVTRFEKQEETLFGETVPKLWDMPDEKGQAIMHQWTSFEPDMPHVVVIRNRLISNRSPKDDWGPAKPRHQELPACYFTRNFDHFQSYLGLGKWRTDSQKAGPPWGKTKPPLKAMACFNQQGQGVAIFSPSSGDTWNFGPHGNTPSDQPKGGPCVHVAPVATVALAPRSTYEYRYWLLTGDAKQLATALDSLILKYSKERGTLTESSNP